MKSDEKHAVNNRTRSVVAGPTTPRGVAELAIEFSAPRVFHICAFAGTQMPTCVTYMHEASINHYGKGRDTSTIALSIFDKFSLARGSVTVGNLKDNAIERQGKRAVSRGKRRDRTVYICHNVILIFLLEMSAFFM